MSQLRFNKISFTYMTLLFLFYDMFISHPFIAGIEWKHGSQSLFEKTRGKY